MSDYLDLMVLRNVAVVALVAGVGITVLFSVAVSRLLAAGCLLIVAATVAVGLWAVLAK